MQKNNVNRKIKFRTWNTIQEFMDEVGTLDLEAWNDEDVRPSNIRLMQYTGLLDKNGKEIYEGDILRKPTPGYEYQKNGNQYKVIKWTENARSIGFNTSATMSGWEIIGNVHQNPELLGGAL